MQGTHNSGRAGTPAPTDKRVLAPTTICWDPGRLTTAESSLADIITHPLWSFHVLEHDGSCNRRMQHHAVAMMPGCFIAISLSNLGRQWKVLCRAAAKCTPLGSGAKA